MAQQRQFRTYGSRHAPKPRSSVFRRLGQALFLTILLAAATGAVSVAFIDLPAPSRVIERPVLFEGLEELRR